MQTYTAQEYFDFCEKTGEWQRMFEFANGQIQDKTAGKTVPAEIVNLVLQSEIKDFLSIYQFTMATFDHLTITNNFQAFLIYCLYSSNYKVYSEGCRIYIYATGKYRIPDVVVVDLSNLKKNEYNELENPLLVVEVLSPSTANVDLNQKVKEYQNIPELQSYIIIWQDQARILQHYKQENSWLKAEYEGIEDILNIDFLEIILPLAVIYKGVKFES